MRLLVRLTPRGDRDQIEGVGPDGELRVRVRAPASDGSANEALLRLLADELDLPRSAVVLETGNRARVKRVRLVGVDLASLTARWPGLEPPVR